MSTQDTSPQAWYRDLAVVVAPGPHPDPALDADRMRRHREFYLKSAHTVVPSGSQLRYRPALGTLTVRAQLGLLFDPTPRHTSAARILDRARSVVLVAELASVDLLRVGWEGTMWHIRYGEGASFDDSCVVGAELRDARAVVGSELALEDAVEARAVDWADIAETCARVSDWMELRPDMLLLAGSAHGPLLSQDARGDAILEYPAREPRLGPGDELVVRGSGLGEVRAVIGQGRD